MSGRNNKPDNDGPVGKPGSLDQFGDKLGSSNEEEFQSAVSANCSVDEAEEPDH
ncbi:hypothetical protein [Cohnella panacarvi]|uniref:hypothetical protein n=1 Tax=Cohnella panacarvi TaxID=400776 RepID=UPI0004BB5915|nr:hypothetical protein [Cohnella panacarvi]